MGDVVIKLKKNIIGILSALCFAAISGAAVSADVVAVSEPSTADAGIAALIAGVPAVIAAILLAVIIKKKNKK
ncbi:MAG: hypothetical protein ACI4Q6_04000 [Huintestinicola sp.]